MRTNEKICFGASGKANQAKVTSSIQKLRRISVVAFPCNLFVLLVFFVFLFCVFLCFLYVFFAVFGLTSTN